MSQPAAVYGVLYISNDDDKDDGHGDDSLLQVVNDLIGKKYNSISSHQDGVIAACTDGQYMVGRFGSDCISSTDFLQVCGGNGYFVGVSAQSHELFSWGNGNSGQLGQTACKTIIDEPTVIKCAATFAAVACGEAFTVALDDRGNAYSFGEVPRPM